MREFNRGGKFIEVTLIESRSKLIIDRIGKKVLKTFERKILTVLNYF